MTSQYRGVTYSKKSAKWQAAINMGGKHVHLGTHVSEQDAAVAFDKAALIIRGDKAKINFSLDNYRDNLGNLVLDQSIALKLQLASADKASGRKKRSHEDGGDGDHGFGPGSSPYEFSISQHDHGGYLQQHSMHSTEQAKAPKRIKNASGQHGGPDSSWSSFQSVISCCMPPGARLRGLIPHLASRTVGVLYEEQEQEGPLQVGAALWHAGSMLSRQLYTDEDEARAYLQTMMDVLSSLGTGTAAATAIPALTAQAGAGSALSAADADASQQTQYLLQAIATITGASGGWPLQTQQGTGDHESIAAAIAAMASSLPQQGTSGTGNIDNAQLDLFTLLSNGTLGEGLGLEGNAVGLARSTSEQQPQQQCLASTAPLSAATPAPGTSAGSSQAQPQVDHGAPTGSHSPTQTVAAAEALRVLASIHLPLQGSTTPPPPEVAPGGTSLPSSALPLFHQGSS